MPDPPFDDEKLKVQDEFKEDTRQIFRVARADPRQAGGDARRPSVTKTELRDLHGKIGTVLRGISCNLPFVVEQFNETVEKTVARAKREFEAYVLHRALSMANPSLVDDRSGSEPEPPQILMGDASVAPEES
jgi:hypothetical protein